MRTLGTCALVLLVPAALPAADQDRIVPEEGAVQLMLLRQHSVQEELKLSKDQVQKVDEMASKQWKAAQEAFKMKTEQRKTKFDELAKANERFIVDTLKPEQHKRLDQISMQVAGLLWAADPRVARALNLTDEQKQTIKDLHKRAHKEVETIIHSPEKGNRTERLDELRKAGRKQLMGALTDEQKTKWKELAGEPFKGKLLFEELEAPGK